MVTWGKFFRIWADFWARRLTLIFDGVFDAVKIGKNAEKDGFESNFASVFRRFWMPFRFHGRRLEGKGGKLPIQALNSRFLVCGERLDIR